MKESLQEATQRALVEGYKNLNENKSKKIETKYDEKLESKKVETAQRLYVVQSNYGDGWEDVYSSEDRDDAKARLKEYEENESEYPHRFITKRPDTSVKDMYKDLHNDIVANKAKWGESKKVESVERDFKSEFLALPEKEQEKYKKCIPPLRRGLSNVEAETIAKERGLDAGILWWVTNIGQLTNFKESKKVEATEDTTSAPDYLEKAFEVEVEYWLKALVDEDSNDEVGKKAQEVLDDKNKMKEIVNELVDGSDDLWEDIHRRIEELAGLHYRESSRVNENKKVTEGLIDSVADYIILRDYNDYKSNDPWQELFVFDHKLSDEEKDKIQKAIDEAKEDPDYDNELVEEKINEVVPYVSNEILSFDGGKIFYF